MSQSTGPKSEWEAQEETKAQAHTNAVVSLNRSRNRTKEAITAAEVNGVPATRCVVNPHPPTAEDIHGGFEQPSWANNLRAAHAAVLEFWADLKPYRFATESKDDHEGKHEDHLADIAVPVTTGWESTGGNYGGAGEVKRLGYVEKPIALCDLSDWRFKEVELAYRGGNAYGGSETTVRPEKVYIPIKLCQLAFEQMNEMLNEVGLAAEVRDRKVDTVAPTIGTELQGKDPWQHYDEEGNWVYNEADE